jgi:hypothetical protein
MNNRRSITEKYFITLWKKHVILYCPNYPFKKLSNRKSPPDYSHQMHLKPVKADYNPLQNLSKQDKHGKPDKTLYLQTLLKT